MTTLVLLHFLGCLGCLPLVHAGLDNANIRQVAIPLCVVDAVANNESVGALEANVLDVWQRFPLHLSLTNEQASARSYGAAILFGRNTQAMHMHSNCTSLSSSTMPVTVVAPLCFMSSISVLNVLPVSSMSSTRITCLPSTSDLTSLITFTTPDEVVVLPYLEQVERERQSGVNECG